MCSCDNVDPPSCYTEKIRRARKQWWCVECRQDILPGTLYQHASGVWDGRPDSFKTCLRCVKLRTAHLKAEEGDCTSVFGDLITSIGECCREDPAYVQAFRQAYKEQNDIQQTG